MSCCPALRVALRPYPLSAATMFCETALVPPQVARLFLGGGVPIVVSESRSSAIPEVPRAEGVPLTTAPLTVLVNDHTASAAEILAGALKDNCRAVLVGALASSCIGAGLKLYAPLGAPFCYIDQAHGPSCTDPCSGGRTYGKGLIQSVYELTDGSGMVLTVGETLMTPKLPPMR